MIKRVIFGVLLLGGTAQAQSAIVSTNPPTYTGGAQSQSMTTSGGLRVQPQDGAGHDVSVSHPFPVTGTVTATSAATATAAAPSYTEGTSNPLSQNLTGDLRVIAKQSGTWTVQPGNTPNTTPWLFTPYASSASGAGITAVVSASAEATHVIKAGAGNLYSAYATNITATAGFLAIVNATSPPGDGAITPLACVPLPANGVASISYNPGPPQVYSTGITAVVTSAATCFTKTTGVITAFISGSAS